MTHQPEFCSRLEQPLTVEDRTLSVHNCRHDSEAPSRLE